jgi:GH35 family endo-1,4-beta-xylanase
VKPWISCLLPCLAVLSACASSRPGGPNATPTPTTASQDDSRLVDAAVASGRLVGAAANSGPLGSEAIYRDTLAAHFNYVTAEYEMKWNPIQAQGRDTYDYTRADAIVDFALSHGMKVKGHAFVWYQAVPQWAESVPDAEFGPLVDDYIQHVAAHFHGKVIAWDVVNEAIADDQPALRDTIFLRKIGPDYIARAFRTAHAADPDALLFYNEYGAEGLGTKSDQVYALVKGLKEQGVPIDGVGLQMHIKANDHVPVADIIANMKRLAALGLVVNISEMDVRVREVPGTQAEKLEVQRGVYHDVAGACLAVPQCVSITLWGFTDAHSWIDAFYGADDPLIFDEAYQKKPAFFGLRDALLGR